MGMMRVELDADGHVVNAPAETGEWYPDDTVIRAEDSAGRRLPHGPLVISRRQPAGWAERSGRMWRNGRWVDDGTGRLLAAMQAQARRAIDDKAGEVRDAYITVAPGQEGTYLVKLQQARAHRAAGYPAEMSEYPMVQARADAYDETPRAATDVILARAAQWTDVGAHIERERERGKRRVQSVADIQAVLTERAAAITALEALKP